MKKNRFAFLWFFGLTASAFAADWPCWRGPDHTGVSEEKVKASASPKILWKAEVGVGFSSFSVAGGRVYTMGHDADKDTVWCFEAAGGKVVWSHSYASDLGDKYFEGGTTGTPTVDGDRVFTLSRWGDVFCFDAASGRIIWNRNVQKDHDIRMPDWGYAGSPLVSGDILLLNVAESGMALDKKTGETLWISKNKDAGYSTPAPYVADGKKCAAFGSGRTYVGIEVATGTVLWSQDWRTSYGVNAADAIVHDGQCFISSGYEKGCALLKLGTNPPAVVWQSRVMRNMMSPSILVAGRLYGVDGNEGKKPALKCIEWATGKEIWSFPDSGAGSIAVAGDQIVLLTEKGELCIGRLSPEGFVPATRAKILSGRCWTVPVVANGRLYCRNAAGTVVCVDARG